MKGRYRTALVWLGLALMLPLAACTTRPHEALTERLEPGQTYEVVSAGSRYFTFILDAPATVLLESHTLPQDAGFVAPTARLLDERGNEVARDWQSGRYRNFRLETSLPAGTWTLHVMTPFACQSELRCHDQDYRYRVFLDLLQEN